MTDKAELSLLLDYYGSFLTKRQCELMRMSADDDMSLSEIAEQVGVSRQAVRDSLSKASEQLASMETSLGLMARDMKLRGVISKLERAREKAASETLALIDESIGVIESVIR